MPNNFQLFAKSPEAIVYHDRYPEDGRQGEPVILQKVDDHLREHFEVEPDPKRWLGNWYHVTGFLIALKGFQLGSKDLRLAVVRWYDPTLYTDKRERWEYLMNQMLILRFLEKHYRSDSWVTIGR